MVTPALNNWTPCGQGIFFHLMRTSQSAVWNASFLCPLTFIHHQVSAWMPLLQRFQGLSFASTSIVALTVLMYLPTSVFTCVLLHLLLLIYEPLEGRNYIKSTLQSLVPGRVLGTCKNSIKLYFFSFCWVNGRPVTLAGPAPVFKLQDWGNCLARWLYHHGSCDMFGVSHSFALAQLPLPGK